MICGVLKRRQDSKTTVFSHTDLFLNADILGYDLRLTASCGRAGKKQEIPPLLPSPLAEGWEWIAAYRYWRRGFE